MFTVRMKMFGMIRVQHLDVPTQDLHAYQPVEAGQTVIPTGPNDQTTLGQMCVDQLVSAFGPLTSSDVITFKQPLTKVRVDQNTPLRSLVERYRSVFLSHTEMRVAVNLTRHATDNASIGLIRYD